MQSVVILSLALPDKFTKYKTTPTYKLCTRILDTSTYAKNNGMIIMKLWVFQILFVTV